MAKLLLLLSFLYSLLTAKFYYRYSPFNTYSFSNPSPQQPSFSNRQQLSPQPSAFTSINNAQNQIASPRKSIDSLFLRLPSDHELDEIILAADSVALLKTIQTAATDDSLSCDYRISYLLEVIGRMNSAIERKKFSTTQLTVVVEGALNEIARLEQEIERLKEEKELLRLTYLKDELNYSIKDLTTAYFEFNAEEYKIIPEQGKVLGFEKEIQILSQNSKVERNRINEEKLKLTAVDANIKEIQRKLSNAKEERKRIQTDIRKSEQVIEQNDALVKKWRTKIKQVQQELHLLRDMADVLRAEATLFQIEVQRIRKDISTANLKHNNIDSQIQLYRNRIIVQKKKLKKDELDDIYGMIQILQTISPLIETEVERHHYECFGEGSVQVEQTGSVTVYILKGQQVGKYLHRAYGEAIQVPSDKTEVKLREVSIFNPAWKNEFGSPFAKASLTEKKLNLGKFSCLNPSAAKTGSGKIIAIDKGLIEVEDKDGDHVRLQLGACTRLESNGKLPRTGQTLYWKGVKNENSYNLYAGTCIENLL